MGKKKNAVAVVGAENAAPEGAGKYRISHTQGGETVELNFHDADRRDSHAAHLRSTGVHNVEAFDVDGDEPADE